MELILSSPFPIMVGVIILVIIGVFAYELLAKKKEALPPPAVLPPTSIPNPKPPKKNTHSNAKALLIVIAIAALVLPSGIWLINSRQSTQNKAAEPVVNVPISTPSLTPPPSATPSPDILVVANAANAMANSCLSLAAVPTKGRIPLTVSFEVHAQDAEGIKEIYYDFGDGKDQTIIRAFGTDATQTVDHTFVQAGSYKTTVKITNNTGKSNDPLTCSSVIEVQTEAGTTPSPTVQIGRGGIGVTTTPSRTPSPTKTAIPTNVRATRTPASSGSAAPVLPESGTTGPTYLIAMLGVLLFFSALTFKFRTSS